MCLTRILSTKDQTVITSCLACKAFYIWHNNLMLSFTHKTFTTFQELLNSLSFNESSLPFPDMEERIILRTPNDDISFAFTETEFEQFKAAVAEAIYMKEVYLLLNH